MVSSKLREHNRVNSNGNVNMAYGNFKLIEN